MRFLVFIVFGLFTFNVFSNQVLHISDTCKKEYIEDLHTLNTKDASLYAYYHYIAHGACPNVDFSDDRQLDRINHHFAKLGNYSAYVRISDDYQNVVEKAESGDIDARALMVMANSVQQTAHFSRTKKLDEQNLTNEEKNRYVDEILGLASDGDIRVLQPSLVYYLWKPTNLEGNSPSAAEAERRLVNANELVQEYGKKYIWLEMFHNLWLLGAKDFRWCAKGTSDSNYKSKFEEYINESTRNTLCSGEFNKSEFKKVGKLSDYERILYFKRVLEPRSLQSPSDLKEKVAVRLECCSE